jgi:hypothetical protein
MVERGRERGRGAPISRLELGPPFRSRRAAISDQSLLIPEASVGCWLHYSLPPSSEQGLPAVQACSREQFDGEGPLIELPQLQKLAARDPAGSCAASAGDSGGAETTWAGLGRLNAGSERLELARGR